jgi:hypothetical protein
MRSIIEVRGQVAFPEFTGERVYMREFRQADGLPDDLRRWQPTIDAMLAGIRTDGPLFFMVDQSEVVAGTAQRRPGVHIDGYWNSGGGHSSQPKHAPSPQRPTPAPKPSNEWQSSDYRWPEGLLLASDIEGCRAFVGEFDGVPNEGGDCSHIDVHRLECVTLRPRVCYAGNVTLLHESIPVDHDCRRTLVRLNVPGWEPA